MLFHWYFWTYSENFSFFRANSSIQVMFFENDGHFKRHLEFLGKLQGDSSRLLVCCSTDFSGPILTISACYETCPGFITFWSNAFGLISFADALQYYRCDLKVVALLVGLQQGYTKYIFLTCRPIHNCIEASILNLCHRPCSSSLNFPLPATKQNRAFSPRALDQNVMKPGHFS